MDERSEPLLPWFADGTPYNPNRVSSKWQEQSGFLSKQSVAVEH